MRLRILHVIHDFLPRHRAGSELYALRLARELARRHDVRILCAEYDPSRPHLSVSARECDGLPVVELVNNWRFASFAESYRSDRVGAVLGGILAEARPDVLHVHSLLNLTLDLPAMAARRGVPTVATLHDFTLVCPSGGQRVHRAEAHVCHDIDPERCRRCFVQSHFHSQMSPAPGGGSGWLARLRSRGNRRLPSGEIERRLACVREAMRHVELFVAPSRALGEDLVRFGLPADRLVISDYGFPALARSTRRAQGGRLRIGYVGTLVWHKGVHVLLDAVRRLPSGRCEVHLFGDSGTFPDYAADLRRRAAGLPVFFRGAFGEAETARVYSEIDVLVVPSLWPENSPLVIHEAFMAGVPVVAARAGGIPELVSHGQSGLLYDPFAADELAGALRSLIDEPERLAVLAAAAPAVKPIAQDAHEWEERYRDVLERGRAARANTETPLVSIVIPTFNGAATLPAVLDAVAGQRADFAFETVAVDSGSTDGTRAILEGRVDRVVHVEPGGFDHGLTRNLGVESARGAFVVLLVQDAVPAGPGWLSSLVRPLFDDGRLAGTFARQVPRPEASALTRHYLAGWVACGEAPRTSALAGEDEFRALAPMERYLRCVFDNVCSCLRRSAWELHPFRATAIAEDAEWAKEVLLAGWRLAYVPEAAVVHSHERPARYELWRTYLVHQKLRSLFGLRTVPTPLHLARAIGLCLGSHLRCSWRDGVGARKPCALARALALAFAFPLGQYLGALSAERGWLRWRPRGV